MSAFAIMMAVKGAGAIMQHQAANAAAAAANAAKYRQDLLTKRALRIKAGFARQAIADTDRMRVRNLDIKADAGISSKLEQMKAVAALKASGLARGQSTDGLLRQAQNAVLKTEAKFLKDMEMKAAQLDFRDREIQQGMDMAWLQAEQQIASTRYQSGPGAMSLAMGLGEAGLEAYTFDKQTS